MIDASIATTFLQHLNTDSLKEIKFFSSGVKTKTIQQLKEGGIYSVYGDISKKTGFDEDFIDALAIDYVNLLAANKEFIDIINESNNVPLLPLPLAQFNKCRAQSPFRNVYDLLDRLKGYRFNAKTLKQLKSKVMGVDVIIADAGATLMENTDFLNHINNNSPEEIKFYSGRVRKTDMTNIINCRPYVNVNSICTKSKTTVKVVGNMMDTYNAMRKSESDFIYWVNTNKENFDIPKKTSNKLIEIRDDCHIKNVFDLLNRMAGHRFNKNTVSKLMVQYIKTVGTSLRRLRMATQTGNELDILEITVALETLQKLKVELGG